MTKYNKYQFRDKKDFRTSSKVESEQLLQRFNLRRNKVSSCSAITENELYNFCIENGYIDAHEMSKGFTVTTPKGMIFEDAARIINEEFMGADDSECQLPVVYKLNNALVNLTDRFEKTKQVFNVVGKDEARLSYAADPNLFNWLSGRILADSILGTRIRTCIPALRNFPSGALNKLTRVKQFILYDAHTFVLPEDACSTLASIIERNYRILDSIGVYSRFVWLETTKDYYSQNSWLKNVITQNEKELCCIDLIEHQSHYYIAKIGFMVDCGYGEMMLFNIQIDERNGESFDIKIKDGRHPIIIHHNEITGSGLMTLYAGQLLAYKKPLPLWLAPWQIEVIYSQDASSYLKIINSALKSFYLRIKYTVCDEPEYYNVDCSVPYKVFVDSKNISIIECKTGLQIDLSYLVRKFKDIEIFSRNKIMKKSYVNNIMVG
ncbi:hypothetical protein LOZ86_09870 [Pectobacterium parvum]|uniref:hypothetical protein n=1 Tax=Pectobacterium TaxID=122277 RepID=UPI000CD04A41|nr:MULTISPECIES: hypothetical protein [Pectobacterium]POE06264.1 hypothetical protein BV921_22645 [Pectobacterium odoriferum]UFK41098.1 hypothetical protein LOZ86_09870 [Pectobacterium parvum]